MRILHVVSSDLFAGVERHVASLARAQHDAGHQVVVVGGRPDPMARSIDRREVVSLPASDVASTTRTARLWVRGADIVHAHMTASELAAVAASLGHAVPVVVTRHFAEPRGRTRLNRWVAGVAARRLAAQIAVSRFTADHVEGPSTVVYAGVVGREPVDPATRSRTVLLAQRLQPEKRSDLALGVFAASGVAAAGWRLVVAGEGTQRGEMEERARRLGIADVTQFLGFRDDVETLMADAGVLLAPRPDEAYGLSVVEAMAQGLPVVAAGAGGHLETVGSVEDPALYDPEDVKAGGAVLAALVADADRRAAYGERLRTAQRTHFTLEAQERATAAVYRSLR